MAEYRALDTLPFAEVHAGFLGAFADYFVNIQPSPEDFRAMNVLRGVDYAASMGVIEDGRLAGFTLNGTGQWRGAPAAYDAGTGVLKEYRGRGYSKEIFRRLLPLLRARGIKRYLLEVITENEKAVKLYEGLGFRRTRRFECVKLGAGSLKAKPGAAAIADAPPAEWPALREALEGGEGFLPSWQNSWDSVCRLPERFAVKAARGPGGLLGYGIVAPASGSVPQLWVRKEARRRGVGGALVAALAAASEKGTLSWVNIEDTRYETLKFLEARGFTRTLSQYEMEFEL